MIGVKHLLVVFSFVLCFFCEPELCEIINENDLTGDSETNFSLENNVYVLNKSNFDDLINSKDTVLVEFYAPWCSHCKNLAPIYEKAAKKLDQHDPPVYLAKVDSTVEKELSERFEVTGYPTLKIFKRGIEIDYEGPRDEDGIVDYMKEFSDLSYKFPKNETLVLTSTNFSDFITTEELMVVMFYAPWCGHCKKMLPEFEKAAKELIKENPPVLIAIVNAVEEKELSERYNITGYPTLKFFRKGKDYPFKSNAQDKWSIVEYIGKHIGHGSYLIGDLKELRDNITSSKEFSVFMAFFNSSVDNAFKVYLDIANERRDDFNFYHSFESSHRAPFKADTSTFFIIYTDTFHSKHEPKWRQMKLLEDISIRDIGEFIDRYHVPLVAEYNDQTKDKQYKNRKPLILFFYTVDWSFEHIDATQLWRQRFVGIAVKHSELTFAVADDDSNKVIFSEFGFDDSGEEINVGIISKYGQKFPMKPMEKFDAEEVHEFIEKFNKGKLKPHLKSQQIPRKQPGPVVTVVGKSFESIVLDPHKDVLIELYAPWCGHCKKLAPIFEQLAKKLKPEKNLVIAKMDATSNDSPLNYSAPGYPTIYFAPSDKKDAPILFDGENTLDGLMNFIKKHGVISKGEMKKEEL